jgi:hypothetical protein
MAAIAKFVLILSFSKLTSCFLNFDDCGAPDWKWDCCPGLEKFFKFKWFEQCTKECLDKNDARLCCFENCHAHKLGVPQDVGESVRSSFSDALTSKIDKDDEKWIEVSKIFNFFLYFFDNHD